jgi:hypothetical protein
MQLRAIDSHLLRQLLGQGFDAHKSMIDPDIHQESDSGVLGWRGAVIDLSRHSMQQPPVETHVLSSRWMTDKCGGDSVAARYVVASVLKNNSGRPGAAEVSDGADLGVNFDAMHVSQCFILVPVKTDALACEIM